MAWGTCVAIIAATIITDAEKARCNESETLTNILVSQLVRQANLLRLVLDRLAEDNGRLELFHNGPVNGVALRPVSVSSVLGIYSPVPYHRPQTSHAPGQGVWRRRGEKERGEL